MGGSTRSHFDGVETGVSPRPATAVALALGVVAVVAATAVGTDAARLEAIVRPPVPIRATLVGGSVAVAVVLARQGLIRLAGGREDVSGLVRGVRLMFLAVAAMAAALGWLLAEALPLVVGLVIAGIDVIETSFLLLVVGPGRVNRTD
jgi:hypothetical protein